ncbi:MAG: hypothetical protein AAGA11_17655 [Pseudomonadota bacterium]
MNRETDLFSQFYEAYLPSTAGETDYVVNWYRTTQPDVLGTTATLPVPFRLTSPSPNVPLLSSTPVRVAWTPATFGPRSMELAVTVRCVDANGSSVTGLDVLSVDDDGAYTYSVSARLGSALRAADPTRRCTVSVRARRSGVGSLSPGFTLGGSLTVRREVTVSGVPLTLEH